MKFGYFTRPSGLALLIDISWLFVSNVWTAENIREHIRTRVKLELRLSDHLFSFVHFIEYSNVLVF